MLGFVNKLFISVQLIFFLDHALLLAKLAQKLKFFKVAVWWSDSINWNYGRFILTCLQEIALILIHNNLEHRNLPSFRSKWPLILSSSVLIMILELDYFANKMPLCNWFARVYQERGHFKRCFHLQPPDCSWQLTLISNWHYIWPL